MPLDAQRRVRGVALSKHSLGTRRRWVVNTTPRLLYPPGGDSVLIIEEVGWASKTVWTGTENLAPHRCSIPGFFLPTVRLGRPGGQIKLTSEGNRDI